MTSIVDSSIANTMTVKMAASKPSHMHRPKKSSSTNTHPRRKKRGVRFPKFYIDSKQGINWYAHCTRGADSQLRRLTYGSWSHTMMKAEPPQTPQGFKRLKWVDVVIQPTDSPDEREPYTYTEVGDGSDLEKFAQENEPDPPQHVKKQTRKPTVTEEEEGPDELELMSAQGMLLPRAYPPKTWGCQSGMGVAYNCCECQVVTYKEWGLAKCVICGHLVCETCTEI